MDKTKLPSSVAVVAIQAPSGLYFIPGKENSFGSLIYPYIYFDSGCSSHLLPFPNDIKSAIFLEKFKDSIWSISYTGGVGALSSPVLIINCGVQPEFEVKFHWIERLFSLPYLRFHLAVEDCERLMNDCKSKLDAHEIEKLEEFVELVKKIKGIAKIEVGIRRKCALIGQKVFGNYLVIQLKPLMLAFDRGVPFEKLGNLVNDCHNIIKPNDIIKNNPDFKELHEEDHEGKNDDNLDLYMFSCEEYDY